MKILCAVPYLVALAATANGALTTLLQARDYVVVYKESGGTVKQESHQNWVRSLSARSLASGIKGSFQVGSGLAGYHGEFTDHEIGLIQRSPDVKYVEYDSIEYGQQDFVYQQQNAPWGLSRVSHVTESDNSDEDGEYTFKQPAGLNTTIYILDTGVRGTHVEFTGRFRWGTNFVNDIEGDDNGHGTHVAGIAAGSSVGVSKYAEIVAVKILDSEQTGSLSNFLKALTWIIDDYQQNSGSEDECHAVINYSAVGEVSDVRDQAISSVIDAGIFFVGAAGNNNTDACNFGPPNFGPNRRGQLIAAAVNYTDSPATFTNFGSCVDVYAPGVNIRSSLNESDTDYGVLSGTSMSSPHVAGLVSYYWSLNSSYTMEDVSFLIGSNSGQIQDNYADTVNKLAYNQGNSSIELVES